MSHSTGQPVSEILNNKGQYVEPMFDRIARRYDFLNHLLSLGIDRYWRKKVIRQLVPYHPEHVLDVATGTGDLAIAVQRKQGCRITGIDVSGEMMAVAEKKVRKRGLAEKISFTTGAAEEIPFEDGTFDAATVAFGVRNFGDLEKGLREILRVIKPGKPLVVLEFSMPGNRFVAAFYRFYLFSILPWLGKIISHDHHAYSYLPASIKTFPRGETFLDVMKKAGFIRVAFKPLTLGIVSLYIGIKDDI